MGSQYSREISSLKDEISSLRKEIEELKLNQDLPWRIGSLQEFLNLIVEQDQTGKLSATLFNPAFIGWAIENKGLLLSDDEVKSLMRTIFKIPKSENSKFPYRGHDDYFYKGLKLKQTFETIN